MGGQREMFPGYKDGAIDRPTVGFEKSITRQSDAEGADINVIMKRAEKTGVLPMYTREALFTDVSAIGSFRDAMELVKLAQEGFLALSPAVREKFGNDPVAFLDFTSNPANLAEVQAMGLLDAPEGAEVVAPPAPAPAEPGRAQ